MNPRRRRRLRAQKNRNGRFPRVALAGLLGRPVFARAAHFAEKVEIFKKGKKAGAMYDVNSSFRKKEKK